MEIEKLIDLLNGLDGVDTVDNGEFIEVDYHGAFDLLKEAASALEQLQRERDAAIRDISSILAIIEEIRQEHEIDDADLDDDLANLCGFYCAIDGHGCYKEDERYHCKNFKWCGKEDKPC